MIYKVKNDENNKYSIVDTSAKWKTMDENGNQIETSFVVGFGFSSKEADKFIEQLKAMKQRRSK